MAFPAIFSSASLAAAAAEEGVTVYPETYFAAANPNSAYDMVLRLPGFSFDEGQSLRGYAGGAGNVLIDGQRVATKNESLKDILLRIPASAVARIELIRGGAPGIDMEGRTVLANIVRKTGATTDVTTTSVLKLYDNKRLAPVGRFVASQRSGGRSIDASLVLYDEWDSDTGKGYDRVSANPSRDSTLASAKVDNPGRGYFGHLGGQTPAWGGVLELAASIIENDQLENEQDRVTQADGLQRRDQIFQKDISNQNEVSLTYTHPLGDKIDLKTVVVQSANLERYRSPAMQDGDLYAFYQLTRTGETIVRQTLTFKAFNNLSFETGGEAVYNFLNGGSDYLIDGVDQDLPSAYVRVNEKRGEAFVSSTWKPMQTLSLETGLRLEGSQISETGDAPRSNRFFYIKPRLFAAWSATPDTQIRFRFEHELGQLNFSDYVASANLSTGIVNAGNPNLRPEQRWASEIGVEQRFKGEGALVATVTHQVLTDVVDVVPIDGVNAPGNIGAGVRNIIALSATAPLAAVWMPGGQLKANQTWTFSSVTDPTTHLRRSISNDRPSVGALSIVNDMPGLKSNWTVTVTGGVRQTAYRIDQVQTLTQATSVLAQWEYKPKKGLSLILIGENLTSRQRRRSQDFYTGLRGQSEIASHEDFAVHYPPIFSMRLRQTW